MSLPNWVYDVLKWIPMICLPAFKIAIPKLFEIWGIPLGQEIAATLDIVAVLLGTLLGASCANYNYKEIKELISSEGTVEVIDVEDVEHQAGGEDVEEKG